MRGPLVPVRFLPVRLLPARFLPTRFLPVGLALLGLGLVRARRPAAVRQGIRARELETKGRLARLWDERRLERYGGAAGASALNYRWGSVRSVVRDITEAREVAGAGS